MVGGTVFGEPVSSPQFPDIREFTGKFASLYQTLAPTIKIFVVNSGDYSQVP